MPENRPQPPCTLAQLVAGMPDATLVGDGSLVVEAVSHPRMLQTGRDIVLATSAEVFQLLAQAPRKPVAALVPDDVEVPEGVLPAYIKAKRFRYALAHLLSVFETPPQVPAGIHPTALVHESARIEDGAAIGPFVTVGAQAAIGPRTVVMSHASIGAGARIGADCMLYPGVRVGDRVLIGNRVRLHDNTCIGPDGFAYASYEPGRAEGPEVDIRKIPSLGTVIIEDDVEILANAVVDRANVGATLIRRGTKMGSMVMIGHNSVIGEDCMFINQVGVAGSCTVGNRVVMAGQAGIADHVTIADDAVVMAKSGVMRDVASREVVGGLPALPRREALQNVMYISKLKELFGDVKALKRRVAELEAEKAGVTV